MVRSSDCHEAILLGPCSDPRVGRPLAPHWSLAPNPHKTNDLPANRGCEWIGATHGAKRTPIRLGRIVDREVDLFSDGLQPNSDGLHP